MAGVGSYLGDKGYPDTSVGLDELDEDLSPDVSQQLFYVLANKWILHDCTSLNVCGV